MATVGFTAVGVVVIVALVTLSAFFSSSETAIFTLPDGWLEAQPPDDRRIAALSDLNNDPHRLLVTILVGNNVVNVAIASISTALLIQYLPTGSAVTVSTVLASFIVLIFGEIVPKSYGLGHARTWAPTVAIPLGVVGRVLYPLVFVFDGITRRMNAKLGGGDVEQPYEE